MLTTSSCCCSLCTGLDIAAMMEAWLVDVRAVCRYIGYLAGQPDADLASNVDVQPHGTWGSAGGSAAAMGAQAGSVCPLVATSDASSHAPHLYAQLGLHRNCLDHMRGMRSAISLEMATTGEAAVAFTCLAACTEQAFVSCNGQDPPSALARACNVSV